jgi:triosephosphate isomerase
MKNFKETGMKRKQIAAANWKMNLSYEEAKRLLQEILDAGLTLRSHQEAIFAVPFPYLAMARTMLDKSDHFFVAAQNCHEKKSGAYTGEVSATMLRSIGVRYCIIGHSERREYNNETNTVLAAKLDTCIEQGLTPIFCCGEPLAIRETESQNHYVATQLRESLFHLPASTIETIIIAYEPIWAIGTGKTASTAQAQEMHKYLRSVLAEKYGESAAARVPILYGGSVKAGNAVEIFESPDVDGGLVGGASLVASDFTAIISALKTD